MILSAASKNMYLKIHIFKYILLYKKYIWLYIYIQIYIIIYIQI